jgi:D-alanyl-D-alanine carboxypeptidase (penicillin-binding protein 5/6)
MVNHNELLKTMDGCDGLKTGFFYAAGFSIAATATKKDKRAIAVVIGAENPKVRDTKAKEILAEGLLALVTNVSKPNLRPSSVHTPAPAGSSKTP